VVARTWYWCGRRLLGTSVVDLLRLQTLWRSLSTRRRSLGSTPFERRWTAVWPYEPRMQAPAPRAGRSVTRGLTADGRASDLTSDTGEDVMRRTRYWRRRWRTSLNASTGIDCRWSPLSCGKVEATMGPLRWLEALPTLRSTDAQYSLSYITDHFIQERPETTISHQNESHFCFDRTAFLPFLRN